LEDGGPKGGGEDPKRMTLVAHSRGKKGHDFGQGQLPIKNNGPSLHLKRKVLPAIKKREHETDPGKEERVISRDLASVHWITPLGWGTIGNGDKTS